MNLDERKKLDEKWVHAGKDNIFPKLQKTLLTIRAVNNHKGSKLEILFDSRLFEYELIAKYIETNQSVRNTFVKKGITETKRLK